MSATIGERFGRLVVVAEVERSAHGKPRVLVRCDCGGERVVLLPSLRSGRTTSCGCVRREVAAARATKHGMYGSHEHVVWRHMIARCENPNEQRFNRYGGRGIRVCDRWRTSFEAFLADVGRAPTRAHEIDRIDVNGHYEPGNVRWAKRKQQARNKTTTRFLTLDGRTQSVADWADETGMPYGTLHARLRNGWSDELAIRTPVKRVA